MRLTVKLGTAMVSGLLVLGMTYSPVAQTQQGGKTATLTTIGLGGRPVGMAEAYTALATDANAPYWNAAGMMWGKPFSATSMQATLPSELSVFYLSASLRDRTPTQDNGSWGMYWINGSITGIPRVTANSDVSANTDVKASGTFDYNAQTIGIAYANWIGLNWSYGINVQGFFQEFTTIRNGKGYGVSVSPSLMWMPTPRLVIGSTVRDLIATQVWETGTYETILPEWRVGIGYAPWDGFVVSSEFKQFLDHRYSPTLHAGVEWGVGIVKIRGGIGTDTLTLGCGLYTQWVDIQYAFVSDINGGIGDNHRISLGIGI